MKVFVFSIFKYKPNSMIIYQIAKINNWFCGVIEVATAISKSSFSVFPKAESALEKTLE